MPSFYAPNDIVIGRNRLRFGFPISRDNGVVRSEQIYDLSGLGSLITISLGGSFPSNPYYKQEVKEIGTNVDILSYRDGSNWVQKSLYLKTNQIIAVATMTAIPNLTMTLPVGSYRVTFIPLYNVNATTTGTGWNFGGGTAVITNYSFRSELASTATANFVNNYVSRSQDFTTAQTSRVNDNRGTIVAEFQVTTAGTIIPNARAEIAIANALTLRAGSVINIEKTS